jgi:hypothetical protein
MINVQDIIVRLRDKLTDSEEQEKRIGGAVDLDIVLDKNDMFPISYQVAYAGTSVQEDVEWNVQSWLREEFRIYVVFNLEAFNGRSVQGQLPVIRQALNKALYGWQPNMYVHPMMIGGDQVESIDLGRYVHSFDFTAVYELGSEDGVDDAGNVDIFDKFYGTWLIGKDEDDNPTTFETKIENLYEGPAIP